MRKEKIQYNIEHGLCTRCSLPVTSGRKMCPKHLEETRLKEKRKREKRKLENRCVRCGTREPRPNKTQCDICVNLHKDEYNAAKMNIYYQRRSSGCCVRCGIKTDNFSVHCLNCSAYMKNKDKKRYAD
ncbi:MAG: hypothetical protein JSW11_00215, partial [Candidatus Heimdallarchaeota archaeon]